MRSSERWPLRTLVWVALGCGALLTLAIVFLNTKARALTDGIVRVIETDELGGGSLSSSDDVFSYLIDHPDRFSLALWDVGNESAGVFHDADRAWPLASTVKILPLALASEKIAAGEWHEGDPTPEVEALYLAGTDADAHPSALSRLDGGTSTLGNALTAMIRFSDNAAADAILLRLGRPTVIDGAARLANSAAPHPYSGTVLLARQGFDGGDAAAWSAAARLVHDRDEGLRRDTLGLSLQQQEAMVRELDNRGSARGYARLIERLFEPADHRYATAREKLTWPMESIRNSEEFVTLATKGGSLPGVLTAAYYAESKTGQKRVLALFLHDLPFATWLELVQSFAHQKLERELLLQPDSLARLRARLGASGASESPPRR